MSVFVYHSKIHRPTISKPYGLGRRGIRRVYHDVVMVCRLFSLEYKNALVSSSNLSVLNIINYFLMVITVLIHHQLVAT